MATKEQYYKLFRSTPKPTDPDTLAVLKYFGDDDKYFFINSIDGRSFLGQAAHFMRELALENDGDLAVILSKARETLEPLMPSNIADCDNVDWHWIGLNFLWGEIFDEVADW
ncbi:MAG: hypothetical protein IM473_16575 [Microcystis sp. M015S2]|uniref:hypothetical protein n=1 Tax=unclassified Microcystis TaxID=2643300 RepID=UPI00258F0A74|nr:MULTISPECIES: hypothetical protein [unclassified Microcystis]MCA2711448.1 hypothetical protein [Microcystis sp. M025S2]MCA2743959.1 hypothetical protein [Microcystis sp. M015S2]MCA2761179.1 hypothetical protein [Microcystis sp. M145S2]